MGPQFPVRQWIAARGCFRSGSGWPIPPPNVVVVQALGCMPNFLPNGPREWRFGYRGAAT